MSHHPSLASTVSLEQVSTPGHLTGRVALVTGASSGIGRAIALELARQGAQLFMVGRDPVRLAESAEDARKFSQVTDFRVDLTLQDDVQALVRHLEQESDRLDILIHSAGVIHLNPMERAGMGDLDLQYAINVRAPYMVTQQLLPFLIRARGQIVFINSSAGLTSQRPEVGQYAATKHALRAVADSLREEVNPKGIRVLSVYLGRTATPMQEALYQQQGSGYRPESLLQPEDVAATIVHALMLPPTAEVTDICMRPLQKSY
jgi:NAD(P)-dependent dehydrogenase (short-subunit alcohol dehydrogenase family)